MTSMRNGQARNGQAPWVTQTTEFWQEIESVEAWQGRLAPPWRYGVPVELSGGGVLELPIRPLPATPDRAVASLIANQASLSVVKRLGEDMTVLAARFKPDLVVGLPTLGFVFAPLIAAGLGHQRWVPLGYSRKFWYRDELSTLVRSITSPDGGKRLYVDPNMVPALTGKTVLLVDDAVSSGRTMAPVWDLLTAMGVRVTGAVVAMRQGAGGQSLLGTERCDRIAAVFDSPLLTLGEEGWWPEPQIVSQYKK
ncbi:MAG: phosphoribosyltransferase [Burkholderiaceae bacterium]